MTKQRRLFVGHAGELAHRLVRAVRPHAMIADFAKSYARRHDRVGVVDEPQRLRELESTLGREAILVMAAEVFRLLPSALGARKGHALDPEEAAFAQMFVPEFLTALIRALEWRPDEFDSEQEAFERDLLMYRRWFERPASSGALLPQEATSPFLDRCALLLDPSTMEEARSAAAEFEQELVNAAANILGHLGLAGTGRPRPKKSSPRRPPPAHKKPARVKKKKPAAKRPKRRGRG